MNSNAAAGGRTVSPNQENKCLRPEAALDTGADARRARKAARGLAAQGYSSHSPRIHAPRAVDCGRGARVLDRHPADVSRARFL
jgi:hypothetical protein